MFTVNERLLAQRYNYSGNDYVTWYMYYNNMLQSASHVGQAAKNETQNISEHDFVGRGR